MYLYCSLCKLFYIICVYLLLCGTAYSVDLKYKFNKKPEFIRGPISTVYYDGVTNDLLTGGLGKTGLQGATPVLTDPESPSSEQLRTLAIYNNYRALVDDSTGGGFGILYGPNIDADGNDTGTEGLVAGTEFIAYARYGFPRRNIVLMVQVPDSFDPNAPCIVTAPSSGSRGVYGAIGTAGDWGLKNNCAVAYSDNGKGTGAHNLEENSVYLINGRLVDANVAGRQSHFTARLSKSARLAFNAETPNRYAFKHAHSQLNPEADWGRNVLQAVEFAFYVLNKKYTKAIKPSNTIVIASSVSNGGGASVLAAERDFRGLIDGIAVSEPNVNPQFVPKFSIVQGNNAPFRDHSRSLFDYTTLLNVYQACANVLITDPFLLNLAPSPARCGSLHAKGLLSATDLNGQAAEAQAIINDYGWPVEQNELAPLHWFANIAQAISVTYANSYAKAKVTDNLCGYSFAGIDSLGQPAPLALTSQSILFGTSNGIPPTGGVELINNDSLGGPLQDRISISSSSGVADQNLDGALCLRSLAIGKDPVTNKRLKGKMLRAYLRIQRSIRRIRATGRLKRKPTIFVTGRSDAILAPNHTSRAYFGLNQLREGKKSNMRYYEIKNAHHLDTINALPGFAIRYVPLHHYYNQALDLMFDHLKNGTSLPPSQVVDTTPRLPGEQITLANVPAISNAPVKPIVFENRQVRIPE